MSISGISWDRPGIYDARDQGDGKHHKSRACPRTAQGQHGRNAGGAGKGDGARARIACIARLACKTERDVDALHAVDQHELARQQRLLQTRPRSASA